MALLNESYIFLLQSTERFMKKLVSLTAALFATSVFASPIAAKHVADASTPDGQVKSQLPAASDDSAQPSSDGASKPDEEGTAGSESETNPTN